MKKFMAIIMVLALVVCLFPMAAFADSKQELNEKSNIQGQTLLRYREYLRVIRTTDYWKLPPYSPDAITNILICHLSQGDTLYFYNGYTDPYGDFWFYCKIINCAQAPNLNNSYGYVIANDVVNVVE